MILEARHFSDERFNKYKKHTFFNVCFFVDKKQMFYYIFYMITKTEIKKRIKLIKFFLEKLDIKKEYHYNMDTFLIERLNDALIKRISKKGFKIGALNPAEKYDIDCIKTVYTNENCEMRLTKWFSFMNVNSWLNEDNEEFYEKIFFVVHINNLTNIYEDDNLFLVKNKKEYLGKLKNDLLDKVLNLPNDVYDYFYNIPMGKRFWCETKITHRNYKKISAEYEENCIPVLKDFLDVFFAEPFSELMYDRLLEANSIGIEKRKEKKQKQLMVSYADNEDSLRNYVLNKIENVKGCVYESECKLKLEKRFKLKKEYNQEVDVLNEIYEHSITLIDTEEVSYGWGEKYKTSFKETIDGNIIVGMFFNKRFFEYNTGFKFSFLNKKHIDLFFEKYDTIVDLFNKKYVDINKMGDFNSSSVYRKDILDSIDRIIKELKKTMFSYLGV